MPKRVVEPGGGMSVHRVGGTGDEIGRNAVASEYP
jgi:hypothetical protein